MLFVVTSLVPPAFCERALLVSSGFIHTKNLPIFSTATQPVSRESYGLGIPYVLKADST